MVLLRLYRGNCKASAACFVNVASCYTLPIEDVLSLPCPFLGRASRSWVPWVVPGWQPLDHIGDASCDACQNSYSKPTQNLFPGWHWCPPLGGLWMVASISLQQDGTGGAPGSKNAEEFQEGQQELQRTLNPPHPLLGALNPPRGKGG